MTDSESLSLPPLSSYDADLNKAGDHVLLLMEASAKEVFNTTCILAAT